MLGIYSIEKHNMFRTFFGIFSTVKETILGNIVA